MDWLDVNVDRGRNIMRKTVLLTGGAGYIGSHTYLALLAAGYEAVILDNFSNSSPHVLKRLSALAGADVLFQEGDVLDAALVQQLARRFQIAAVVHFAGFKAVAESVGQPLKYYLNNIGGLTSLLRGLSGTHCRRLVYSSSATVYGAPASVPITEDFPRSFANPYGHTKLVGEDILFALVHADPQWQIAVLRYFNPAGAHPSGSIGESPNDVPNNLMPYITQVAVGRRSHLNIYGGDYPTVDGTGVRDYIHVCDLADGHVAAVDFLLDGQRSVTVNLGTGAGTSVLQLVRAFEHATGASVPFKIVERRPGDIAECYANCDRARAVLGWSSTRSTADICTDAWRWQSQNPQGFT